MVEQTPLEKKKEKKSYTKFILIAICLLICIVVFVVFWKYIKWILLGLSICIIIYGIYWLIKKKNILNIKDDKDIGIDYSCKDQRDFIIDYHIKEGVVRGVDHNNYNKNDIIFMNQYPYEERRGKIFYTWFKFFLPLVGLERIWSLPNTCKIDVEGLKGTMCEYGYPENFKGFRDNNLGYGLPLTRPDDAQERIEALRSLSRISPDLAEAMLYTQGGQLSRLGRNPEVQAAVQPTLKETGFGGQDVG